MESKKIMLLVTILFFSCVAYGQTEPVTAVQITEPPQAEEIKHPPSLEPQRVDSGRIGVVVAGFRPEANFEKPMTKGDGASHGAKTFAGHTVGALVWSLGRSSAALATALALAPVAAGVGAVIGGIEGASADKIKETEDTLNGYLASLDFQGALRDRLLTAANEQSHSSFVTLNLKGPGTQGEEVAYDMSSYPDIDIILEIGIKSCHLSAGFRKDDNKDINPDLNLIVDGHIRFLTAKDGKVLRSAYISYPSHTHHKLVDWGANNVRSLKEEMDRAFQSLAEQIIGFLPEETSPSRTLIGTGIEKNTSLFGYKMTLFS
jgi:hypothetical protein